MSKELYFETYPKLKEIIKLIQKKKLFDGILLYGSSLSSKTPNDYDFILYKQQLEPIDILKFYELMIEINETFEEANSAFIYGARKPNGKVPLKLLGFTLLDNSKFNEDKTFFSSIQYKGYVIFEGEKYFKNLWSHSINQEDYIKSITDEDNQLTGFHLRKFFIKTLEFKGIYDVKKDFALKKFMQEFPEIKISKKLQKEEATFVYLSDSVIGELNQLKEYMVKKLTSNPKVKVELSYLTQLISKYKLIELWYQNAPMKDITRILIHEQREYENNIN